MTVLASTHLRLVTLFCGWAVRICAVGPERERERERARERESDREREREKKKDRKKERKGGRGGESESEETITETVTGVPRTYSSPRHVCRLKALIPERESLSPNP